MSRRILVLLATLAALAVLASPAAAQLPAPPAPPPTPVQAQGKATLAVAGGVATKRIRYFARKQNVLVTGVVKPYVAGQTVTLSAVGKKGKVLVRRRAAIVPGPKGSGRYRVRFKTRGAGFLRLVVKHNATPQQVGFRAKARRIQVVHWRSGAGSKGTKVVILQRQLRLLGYAVPVTGFFDGGTARAVTAYRKTNGLGRTGFAAAGVYDRLLNGRGAFKLRFPGAGRHVEFDWSRQVLVLADKGRPFRTYHASSGKPSTPTVFGTFHFYRKSAGTNSHGMVDSSYFIGGYAIHGYASVPNFAASHGCIRVPIPNARAIYDHVSLGETIFVYR
jgi:lipoprotein-anchoring transpeptidase ErfK/SrfK